MGNLTIKWLFNDSLAALSAISLPLMLQCPGTHSRVMFLFVEFKILSILILILWSDLLLFKNCSELKLSLNITKLLLSSVDIYLSAFSMVYNSALKTLVWCGNLFLDCYKCLQVHNNCTSTPVVDLRATRVQFDVPIIFIFN